MALKPSLAKGIKKSQDFQLQQSDLKDKYNVQEENVLIVEKSNMVKFLICQFIHLFHFIFQIALFLLALTGLVAVIYPVTRAALWQTLCDIYNQLLSLF